MPRLKANQSKATTKAKSTNGKRKSKKCTRCRLHGVEVKQTKEHAKTCPFLDCPNFLCRLLTTYKQQTMKIQLDIWRRRSKYIPSNKENNEQLCDKCRNHLVRTKKQGHEKSCQFRFCEGVMCKFSHARRKIMSFFLKIMRSKVRCEVFESNYKKLPTPNGKSTLNSSYDFNNQFMQNEESYIDDVTFSGKYHPAPQTYPYGAACQLQYTTQVPVTHKYHVMDAIGYPQLHYHPQSDSWPYSNNFREIYLPSDKISINSYMNPPTYIVNCHNYNVHSARMDSLPTPENGNSVNINHKSSQNSWKDFYRPWL